MTLFNIVHKYSWEDILLSRKFEYYKDFLRNERGYKIAFEHLLKIEPLHTNDFIILQSEYDESDKRSYIHVNAKYSKKQYNKEFNIYYEYFALDNHGWDLWLGLKIEKETLTKYCEIEILIHCLWEMTYYGYEFGNGPTEWDEIFRRDFLEHRNEIKKYAAFFSYAHEDQEIVWKILPWITGKGYKIWYDGFDLKVGDSIRQSIDRGLVKAHYGIILFSNNYVMKKWTGYELDGLVMQKMVNSKIILPIWHNISLNEMMNYSPSLACIKALSTSELSYQQIAFRLVDVFDNDSALKETRCNKLKTS